MRLVAMLTLVVSINALSQEPVELKEVTYSIQQLIQKQDYGKAYEYSLKNAEMWGIPEFDLLYGIAALKTNHPHEAVFALERVVAAKPHWLSARIQLASAYLKSKNLPAAQEQIKLINQAELNSAQQKAVSLLSANIESKLLTRSTQLKQTVSLGLGQDSNINAGTTEDSVFIPSLNANLPLSPQSQELSGHYWTLGYQGNFSRKMSQNQGVKLNWGVNDFQYADKSEFNRTIATVGANYLHNVGKNTYTISANITPLLVQGNLYRVQSMAYVGVDHDWTNSLVFTGSLGAGEINNRFSDNLDMSVSTLEFGARYISAHSIHKLSFSLEDEDSKQEAGEHNAKDSKGLSYLFGYAFDESMQYVGMLSYKKQKFDDQHPLFLAQRDEILRQVSNTLLYKHTKDLALKFTLNYQHKSSNLNLYEYDRYDAGFTLSYHF